MKILFAGSEALPFASTGGLGDVLGSLPSAIAHAFPYADVRVVLPLYSSISHEYRSEMTLITETQVAFHGVFNIAASTAFFAME